MTRFLRSSMIFFALKKMRYLDLSINKNIVRDNITIIFSNNEISLSQIFPFIFYARKLNDLKFNVRFININHFRRFDNYIFDSKTIVFQPWFDIGNEKIISDLEYIKSKNKNTKIVFLDSYAHNDLRLANVIDEYIDFYFKKSIFADKSDYRGNFVGDTNITDYYYRFFNIKGNLVNWNVPKLFLSKLRLFPGFFTDRRIMHSFLYERQFNCESRKIDLNIRLGCNGAEWYSSMRNLALIKAREISEIDVSKNGSTSRKNFMKELSDSKLCLSPFGYGEVCWRDFEAFSRGAVVIKQKMSHLSNLPDVFQSWESYLPVEWDFSDLEHVVKDILSDEERRINISNRAFKIIHNYLIEERFIYDVRDML